MKPVFHNEFIELSALFSGEISDEEWALLQVNLAYCESCHERFFQFQRVSSEVIPELAAALAKDHDGVPEEPLSSVADVEERLMRRLDSLPSPTESENKRKFRWNPSTLRIAVSCAVLLGCIAAIRYVYYRSAVPVSPQAAVANTQPPEPDKSGTSRIGVEEALKRSEEENADLKRELAQSEDRSRQSSLALSDIQSKLEAEQTSVARITQDRDNVVTELAAARAECETMRRRISELSSAGAGQSTQVAALEPQARDLNLSLEEKDTELSENPRCSISTKIFFPMIATFET